MALIDDLKKDTQEIAISQWDIRDGNVIPENNSLTLGNEAVSLEATFLFADLVNSTELVIYGQSMTAEIVKAYLMGTTRIIRSMGGEIRSFDGDRVMGVFIGKSKNTLATEAALKINYFFREILKPEFKGIYKSVFTLDFDLEQVVGIDTGKVMVIRSGIRNNNDLMWIGKAPNIAAKLSAIRTGYSTYITKKVFDHIHEDSKYGGEPRRLMWESDIWTDGKAYDSEDIYCSNWHWRV